MQVLMGKKGYTVHSKIWLGVRVYSSWEEKRAGSVSKLGGPSLTPLNQATWAVTC